MNEAPCENCGDYFSRSPRHKGQSYCKKTKCKRAKKARWQNQKMKNDPVYRAKQKKLQEKRTKDNPDYWKEYRCNNPKKTERNRILQKERNRKRNSKKRFSGASVAPPVIATMDASSAGKIKENARYYLVPLNPRGITLTVRIQEVLEHDC